MRKDAIRVAKKLGITLSRRDAKKDFTWNGKSIATKNLSTHALWHEIAHWLVSAPERRKYINFGLGEDVESMKDVPKEHHIVLSSVSQHEEELASLLGIAYEAFFNEPFIETLDNHNWIEREVYNHRTRNGNITSRSWKKRQYKATYQYVQSSCCAWKVISKLNQHGLLKHHQPSFV